MRQGPAYSMWIKKDKYGPFCPVPLELAEEFQSDHVEWKDNADGTYTLTPYKEYFTK